MFQKHLGKWEGHYLLYFTRYQVGSDLKDVLVQPFLAKEWPRRGNQCLTTVECMCAVRCRQFERLQEDRERLPALFQRASQQLQHLWQMKPLEEGSKREHGAGRPAGDS